MFKNNIDILYLTFSSKGRDVDIVAPLLVYLEKKMNLKIKVENIFLYSIALLKYRPKYILFPTMSGSRTLLDIAKKINSLGIPIISLVTEGDYVESEESVKQMFWSFNYEHRELPSLHVLWTKRTVDLVRKYIPESKEFNLTYGGAIGFDRYKLFNFMRKNEFLVKINKKNYKKIIGIGGFGFNPFGKLYYENNKQDVNANYGEEFIEFHRKSRDLLKEVYKNIIDNNPDILFILKHHPGSTLESDTEFYNLPDFENIYEIRDNNFNIADLISVSDIWVAYESTTCLEAWLLNKQTLLVNPLGGKFIRSNISQGSPILQTSDELQNAINEFYLNNKINTFTSLQPKRKEIIRDIIEYDDGLNHKRTAEIINDFIKNDHTKSYSLLNIQFLKSLWVGLVRKALCSCGEIKVLRKIQFIDNQYKNLKKFSFSEYDNHLKKYSKVIK